MEVKDIEAGLVQTNILVGLLNEGNHGDLPWQKNLDETFLKSIFDYNSPKQQYIGPDQFRYIGFKLPGNEGQQITVMSPKQEFDHLLEFGSGAAILDPNFEAIYVYSPGDIVSISLYGTAEFAWQGGWDQEPDHQFYAQGGEATVARPNTVMFPPQVARCLELYLSQYCSVQPNLKGRIPGVALIRPGSHTMPEDASDLILNIFTDDFPEDDGTAARQFITWIGYLLPRHLRKRLIMQASTYLDSSNFTSLSSIYTEAGLQAIQR